MDIYQDNHLGEGVGAVETGTFRARSGYAKVPTNGISLHFFLVWCVLV